jgi:hypothetical protein
MIRYGETEFDSDTEAAAGNSTTTFKTVSGQGMVYDASLYLTGKPTHSPDKPVVTIDGSDIFRGAMDVMAGQGVYLGANSVAVLSEYDTVNGDFLVLISGGYNFDSSLAIGWQNRFADAVNISWTLRYALVS